MIRTSLTSNLENSNILAYPSFDDRINTIAETFDQLKMNLGLSKEVRTITLHEAVEYNDPETAKRLLEEKTDVNKRDEHQMTPLHIAVVNGNYKMTKFLLNNGADVNPTRMSAESKSPLFLAVERDSAHIAHFLLSRGALVHKARTRAYSVVDMAKKNRNYPLAKLLEQFALKQTSIVGYMIRRRSDNNKETKKIDPLRVTVLKTNTLRVSRRYAVYKPSVPLPDLK